MLYRDDIIRAQMAAKRLTNQNLAEITGLSAPTISYIKNGHKEVALRNLAKVAESLGITMRDLFTFDEVEAA
jgi:transcriptional regulator with XRE-family HTH domain